MIFFTQPPPRPSDAMIGDRFSRRDEFLASLEEVLKLVSVFSLGGLFPIVAGREFQLLSGTLQ